MNEQRSGLDRRADNQPVTVERRRNPNAGRRVGDLIADLSTHPSRFVSITVALDYLNREVCPVSRQTLYAWIDTGELKATRVAREFHIKTDDLRWFIYKRRKQSA